MKIVFLHPDLGIGGAERLVVDAAVALKSKGHEIRIVTNQFSPTHCFQDVLDFDIQIIDLFPRSIFGKMNALCAYIRMCIAAIVVCWSANCDIIFCDQISAALVILKWFSNAKLLFYCHFPDQLLTKRESYFKKIYRWFLDGWEQFSTGKADLICVNSEFTEGVFRETFTRLAQRELHVLYPTLNTQFFDTSPRINLDYIPPKAEFVFLSINRFEVKKNIELALEAFAQLHDKLEHKVFAKCFLVIAGGYDPLNKENEIYYDKLCEDAHKLGIPEDSIAFIKSPSDVEKIELFRRANLVIYTPKNEHFGIVPIEAMYMERCVLATNTGGPKESIVHGRTGYLCDANPYAFYVVLNEVVNNPEKVSEMGRNGKLRVQRVFAFEAFSAKLNRIILSM
uniref:Alpha-1,3/1,6-mannosyltransferase ALG2 n=1 Tax=Panagrolaimus sp. ES5 TaxID=591445 RepID=A0AC34FH69_9BILA